MFGGQLGATTLHNLKQKLLGESSYATLNDDLTPEIELSDYQRAPSPGSESPSGLLNGESFKVEPIADLDLFFERLYSYYCEKGLWFFVQLKDTLEIRQFYINSLGVTDSEMQTMPWASILEKVVQIQERHQLCVVKDLSAHDIVMRLMRKENYLIGMLNKGVLAFPISSWVPGAGPTVKKGPDGTRYCLMLTKTLEWTLNWCILHSMFDSVIKVVLDLIHLTCKSNTIFIVNVLTSYSFFCRNFCIRKDFVSDRHTLKKRLTVVGIAMLLLSPFLVVFMLVYLFLTHAEQFYKHPSTASSRRWSNLSKWIFREFNEVNHLFKHRINSSVTHASDYLKQFPSPILSIVAKFVSFVSGGFAAILIIIAFLDESLLEGHIFGRNLFWYAAVFGAITAIGRALVSDELLVLDPHGTMSLTVQHTHYMPKKWRGKENTEFVRVEFETLFQYTGKLLLEEMASIFLTPFLLIFVVPKRVDEILQFIEDFTVDVEGVGHVCSFSLFDFQKHGNSKYASPHNSSSAYRSSQGKMEKSFLSFQTSYPSWEPSTDGKQFLSTLKAFKERKFQEQGIRPGYISPNQLPQWAPTCPAQGDPNSYFSRDTGLNVSKTAYQRDFMWFIDIVQNNHPYILDWYYTSSHHNGSHNVESGPIDVENSMENVWDPPDLGRNPVQYDENWGSFFEDRMRSNLEASTSAPLSRGSVLHHHDSGIAGQTGKSHWWARGGAGSRRMGPGPQTSFLEPPNFNQQEDYDYHDNYSNRSFEQHGQQFDLRGSKSNELSKTFYMGDIEGGKFDLPFDDIYESRSQSPPRTRRSSL
ncbi:hypothetical protein M8C21_031641 [Ambrosia artemisiifolia]|uniref:Autophagy-related protein 9 n=1 Tax=Ambrosia artemisiifolia TaxID=4212 RepID=A0AAD5C5J3_AMBAR|nr:hypothetical protein M8C21_031641 [Ambrosia artemisiifolia]